MADLLEFGLNDLPWAPLRSEPVEVLRYYDGPQLGIFRQNDVYFLHASLIDLPSGAGLWLYVPIQEEMVETLRMASDHELDDLVSHSLATNAVTLAALIDGRVGALLALGQGLTPESLRNGRRAVVTGLMLRSKRAAEQMAEIELVAV